MKSITDEKDKEIKMKDDKLSRLKLQMADALKGNSWYEQYIFIVTVHMHTIVLLDQLILDNRHIQMIAICIAKSNPIYFSEQK